MNKWLLQLITMVVTVMSPELRKGLEVWLDKLEADAKKTANPWDDILVGLLKSMLFSK
ncbi:unnamed protein product [marine sediment metagenome]|uniref:Uncharacterized protein n=1 Tax=marine sediment metagenome TaxID=412755 RepID=X1TP25_9ZZZZ